MSTANDDGTPAADEHEGRSDRPIGVTSLVAGVVFLAMAAAFAIADLDSLEDQVRIVWPSALLAIGLGMLLGVRGRRR